MIFNSSPQNIYQDHSCFNHQMIYDDYYKNMVPSNLRTPHITKLLHNYFQKYQQDICHVYSFEKLSSISFILKTYHKNKIMYYQPIETKKDFIYSQIKQKMKTKKHSIKRLLTTMYSLDIVSTEKQKHMQNIITTISLSWKSTTTSSPSTPTANGFPSDP